jgi:hypothetical protein
LVNQGDARTLRLLRIAEMNLLIIDKNRAFIRPNHPGQDLDECALSCPVVAAQSVHLPSAHFETDIP